MSCNVWASGKVHHAVEIGEIVIVTSAVVKLVGGHVLNVLICLVSVQAVARVLQSGSDMHRSVCKSTVNETKVSTGAIATEGFSRPHFGLEQVAGISISFLVPPGHNAGKIALLPQERLVRVHVETMPREELSLDLERMGVSGHCSCSIGVPIYHVRTTL